MLDDDSRGQSSLVARIVRGVKASFAAQILYMLSTALLVVILTRLYLSPESFGRLFFALSVLGVVGIFASLGLPKSTARYVNEYAERDPTQLRYIIRWSVAFLALLAAVVGVVIVVVSEPLARWLGEPIGPFLLVGAAYLAARAFSGHFSMILQGFNRITWSATVTAIDGVGRVVVAVALVAAGFGALGALWGYVAGYAIAALVGGALVYRYYYAGLAEAVEPEAGLARRLVEYSVPLTATKGAGVIDGKLDSVLIGVLLNTSAVGFYIVAKQVADVLSAPAGAFGTSLSPALGEQKAQQNVARASRLYAESLRYVLLLYIPAAAGLILVAAPVIRLVFGADYLPAVPVLQVLSVFTVAYAVTKITSDGLDYLGRARSRAIAKAGMAVSNVVLNLLLIPVLGVVGAAVATAITFTAYTFVNVYFIHQELSLDVRGIARDLMLISLITLVMAAAVVVVVPYVSGPVTLAGVVLLGGGVWMVLSVLSGMLDLRRLESYLL